MQAVAEAEAAQDLAVEAEGERAARARAGAAAPTRVGICGKRGKPQGEAVEVVSAAESRAAPVVVEAEPAAVGYLVAAEEREPERVSEVAVVRAVAVVRVSGMAAAQE